MAITQDDFKKVWASTSPLTPYSFSASQYKEGWNFIGSTPPSRQMWDFLQKNNDEKMQYLANNYLPLSGGKMTGVISSNTSSDVDATGTTRYEETLSVGKDKNNLDLGNDFYSAYDVEVFHGIRAVNPNVTGGSWSDIRVHVNADKKRWISADWHSNLTDGTQDNSSHIPTTSFIHSNYLSLAGGTLTDQLIIKKNNGTVGAGGIKLVGNEQNFILSASNTNVTKGTAPSSTQFWGIDFYGKDVDNYNKRIGMIEARLNESNVSSNSLIAYNCTTNTNTETCKISVNVDGNGNVYTSAPTPAADDNSTKIATTAFVRSIIPAGVVLAYAKGAVPTGWLLCDGSAVSRTDYAALYAVIGTTYGAGNGSTTFNLPNLTDKFIQGNGTVGTKKDAGLPNITGNIQSVWDGSTGAKASVGADGAFARNKTDNRDYFIYGGSYGYNEHGSYGGNFNASRSSNIYGKSSTVQPPALTMRYIIKY